MLNVSSLSIGPLSTPTCPYCRQRMTVLLPFFSEVENNAADLDEASIERRQRICDNIRSYNRLYSGEIISLNYLIGNRPPNLPDMTANISISLYFRRASQLSRAHRRSAHATQTFMAIFLVRRWN